MENYELVKYGNTLITKLFSVLDLTKNAKDDEAFFNIEKFIEKIIIEVDGSKRYYSNTKNGNKLTDVVMKLNGIKKVTDYNVRKKIVLDSVEIISRIMKELE